MKRTTKLLSLLMALLLLAGLASCTGAGGEPTATPSTAATATPAPQDDGGDATPAPTEEPDAGVSAAFETPALPLTDDSVTFSWFFPITQENGANFEDGYNSMEGRKELERRTGIHIDFFSPTYGTDVEQFNLMITSGEYSDLVNSNYYPGGLDKAVEDEVYLDVTDLVDQYCPNYKYWRENKPDIRRGTITDAGHMPGFYQLNKLDGKSRPWGGLYIRQDWLDELSLPTPVTFEDWDITLTAFREQKGADAALFLEKTGIFTNNEILSGFDTGGNLYQVDGQVKYGPVEPGYKEYIELMHRWYEEGLIAADFMTNQSMFYMPDTSYTTTGRSGIFWNVYMPDTLALMSGNPEYKLSAILPPVRNEGDTLHFSGPAGADGVVSGITVAITTACKDPVLAAKWCDYQYSPDGMILSNWGVENKSFTYVDGQPKYVDEIDGVPFADVKNSWIYIYGPTVYDFDAEYSVLNEVQYESTEVWGLAKNDYVMPNVTLTTEEGERNASILNEINTYVAEMTLKFIVGEVSLDQYDSYLAQIKSMGVDDVLAIQQAAIDRYYAR